MIIYKSNAADFKRNVDDNVIADIISDGYINKFGRGVNPSEKRSWNNSMKFMETIVRRSEIPDDCGIMVEYNIPSTSRRIDFVITGHDEEDRSNFVIVELKQWESAEATDKDGIVETFLARKVRETVHPSYQAQSYRRFLEDMHESVYRDGINPISCAYLHNYNKRDPEPLLEARYTAYVEDTPVFFKQDSEKLEDFIKKYVGKGNGYDMLYEIENGRIKPSKQLIENLTSVFEGNRVFNLIDDQKVAYESIVSAAEKTKGKKVILVKGGPGTGKSVVAINSLVTLLEKELNVRFVAPNASFRETLLSTLVKDKYATKKRLQSLFSGSGSFFDAEEDIFDVIICDEAHRLKGAGAYMYRGESQVEDVMKAGRVSVFFVDDNQMIRPDDEGSMQKVRDTAAILGIPVEEITFEAQFRCAGAEGFVNWLDHSLQIKDTANFDGWDRDAFEFKIFENPNDLKEAIFEKDGEIRAANSIDVGENELHDSLYGADNIEVSKEDKVENELEAEDEEYIVNSSRLLAGFAWRWTPEKKGNKDAEIDDVIIEMPEGQEDFAMPWNSRSNQYTWAMDPDKRDQIGCIHTSQGLEFDYVGVIIGDDLQFRLDENGNPELYASYANYKDTTGKKGLKNNEEALTTYVKRIYKVLMSRGIKGCYIYCIDKNVEEYFKTRPGINPELDIVRDSHR